MTKEELNRWKLALKIMKGELDDQLDEIISSYRIEEEKREEAANDGE